MKIKIWNKIKFVNQMINKNQGKIPKNQRPNKNRSN